jgi:hypothetical protein
MTRPTNDKCQKCALENVSVAKQKGCWNGKLCHARRSYYRKGRQKRVQEQWADAIGVDFPAHQYCVLVVWADKPYRPQDDQLIHAIAAELWQGDVRQRYTKPVHVLGIAPRQVREYAAHLLQKLGEGKIKQFAHVKTLKPSDCAIEVCPIRGKFNAEEERQ